MILGKLTGGLCTDGRFWVSGLDKYPTGYIVKMIEGEPPTELIQKKAYVRLMPAEENGGVYSIKTIEELKNGKLRDSRETCQTCLSEFKEI